MGDRWWSELLAEYLHHQRYLWFQSEEHPAGRLEVARMDRDVLSPLATAFELAMRTWARACIVASRPALTSFQRRVIVSNRKNR